MHAHYQPGDRVRVTDADGSPLYNQLGVVTAVDPTRPYGLAYSVRIPGVAGVTNFTADELRPA